MATVELGAVRAVRRLDASGRLWQSGTLPLPGCTVQRPVFTIVSFEGTDPYSQAGGLGVRVSGLARTLSELGFETHLFFIGDPSRPGEERVDNGTLVLHRWAQWIRANCHGGVYEAEEEKVSDLTRSLPRYLIDRIIRPALNEGNIPVAQLEEWQTAECACVAVCWRRNTRCNGRAIFGPPVLPRRRCDPSTADAVNRLAPRSVDGEARRPGATRPDAHLAHRPSLSAKS